MNFSAVDSILPNIQPKLSQYQYIMRSIRSANVATDRDFQRPDTALLEHPEKTLRAVAFDGGSLCGEFPVFRRNERVVREITQRGI